MFNYSKKISWLLLVIVTIFSAFSFAKDDCENVNVGLWRSFGDFLSADDLDIARDHLRSFCCVEKPNLSALIWNCENLVMWPESPYWYDHLIDVWLRKLDAESLYPEMVPDLQWKEWRDFLKDTEKMKNPEIFSDKYKKYWIQSGVYLFASYKDADNLQIDDILSKTQWFNLYDKYINYCFIVMAIYDKWLNLKNIDIVADWYYWYYGTCLSMVKARIRQETSLAMAASQYNAANFLVGGLTSYTKQFVQNRLMKLFDKIVAISSLFNTLVKQAPLSDTCTK